MKIMFGLEVKTTFWYHVTKAIPVQWVKRWMMRNVTLFYSRLPGTEKWDNGLKRCQEIFKMMDEINKQKRMQSTNKKAQGET